MGNFEPSLLRTPHCEAAVLTHRKGEVWPMHYQQTATEINVLLDGQIRFTFLDGRPDETVTAGEVFLFPPGQRHAAQPIFEQDCTVVCIKTPSLPNDKVEL